MKKIQKILKNKLLKLIITLFLSLKTPYLISANTKNNMISSGPRGSEMPMGMPMISEAELQEMMKNAVDEYKKLPESEKELMCKNFGIKMEDLDEIMKEAETIINQTDRKKDESGIFNNDKIDSENTLSNQKKELPQPIKSPQKIKQNQGDSLQIIKKTISILQTLTAKMKDEYILKTIISNFSNAYEFIEISIYYLSIIAEYIKNKEDKINEISGLISMCNKIINLNDQIIKIITYQEYSQINQPTNFFSKYTIKKNSILDLQNHIEKEIEINKKKMKNLESEYEKTKQKETKKEIFQLEFKIDDLEKDLIEIKTNAAKIKNENLIEKYQTTVQESTLFIANTLKKILMTDKGIELLESIIKKYFPEEYKIGKQKEQAIKLKMDQERKFNEQKGSQGNQIQDRGEKEKQNTRPFQENNENSNSFQYQPINDTNDYEGNDEESLKHPSVDQNQKEKNPKELKNIDEKAKKNDQENPAEKEQKEINYPIKKKKKEKNDIKKQKKDIMLLKKAVKELQNTIAQFLLENPERKFNQENTIQLQDNLQKSITEIQKNIKQIDKKNLLIESENRNFILTNKEESPEKISSFIKNEKKKLELLGINEIDTRMTIGQDILYTLSLAEEILKDNFNEKKRINEYKYIKNEIENITQIIKKIQSKMIQIIEKSNKDIPYWLQPLEFLEQKSILHKKISDQKLETSSAEIK